MLSTYKLSKNNRICGCDIAKYKKVQSTDMAARQTNDFTDIKKHFNIFSTDSLQLLGFCIAQLFHKFNQQIISRRFSCSYCGKKNDLRGIPPQMNCIYSKCVVLCSHKSARGELFIWGLSWQGMASSIAVKLLTLLNAHTETHLHTHMHTFFSPIK